MYIIQLLRIAFIVAQVNGYNRLADINDVDGYLNICLDGIYQKNAPGLEDLYGQCAEWKDRNCCFENTTRLLQEKKAWHNFNISHCGQLSPMCRGHFIENFCFYECSPNVGPWLVKVSGMESRKERFYKVPLCEKECDLWWKDCLEDLTCVRNWQTDFDMDTGTNVCPPQMSCRKFKEVFTDAKDFCETVFDNSYEVVKNPEPCMVFNFHNKNPNDEVAKQQAQKLFANQSNVVKYEKFVLICLFLLFVMI